MILHSTVYPSDWKLSTISPIHKKGDPLKPENYRPISLLSSTSKLFEKCIDEQMRSFLYSNNILSTVQHGYRTGFSTNTALMSLTDTIYNNITQNKYSLTAFLDLSKAFDTVDHSILLDKLSHYGIRGSPNALFRSYLSGRTQMVRCNDKISSEKTVNIGVPQGSILGPLLYIIYVNDIERALEKSNCILYADDTSLIASNDNVTTAKHDIEIDLIGILKWFTANKLKVNESKTQLIIFGSKGMLQKISNNPLHIDFGNERITCQGEVRYLGLTLDSNLSFKPHVNNIRLKISKQLGILSHIKHLLSFSIRKQVYSALITPHINYCSSIWSCCSQTEIHNLHILLNRACRSILNVRDKRAHVQPFYDKLGWLTCSQIIKLNFAIDAYKVLHNIYCIGINLPPLALDHHQYNTRNRYDFRLPDLRTEIERRQLRYKIPRLLNELPPTLDIYSTMSVFKKSYKRYLMGNL